MEKTKEVKQRSNGHSYEVYEGGELIDTCFVAHEDHPEWITSHSMRGLEVRQLKD